MTPRLNYSRTAPEGMQALGDLSAYVKSVIDPELKELVNLRASQINGCAYCIAMHVNEAMKLGMSDDRIQLLSVWRETSLYTEREQAALAYTEAVTRIADGPVSDALYDEVRQHFPEKELVDLTLLITVINAYNRIAITFQATPQRIKRP